MQIHWIPFALSNLQHSNSVTACFKNTKYECFKKSITMCHPSQMHVDSDHNPLHHNHWKSTQILTWQLELSILAHWTQLLQQDFTHIFPDDVSQQGATFAMLDDDNLYTSIHLDHKRSAMNDTFPLESHIFTPAIFTEQFWQIINAWGIMVFFPRPEYHQHRTK